MVDIKALEREMVGRGHRVIERAYQDMFRSIYYTRFVDCADSFTGLSFVSCQKRFDCRKVAFRASATRLGTS